MQVDIIAAHELDRGLEDAWRGFQAADGDLRSPFFSPEFCRIVGTVCDDLRIAVLTEAGAVSGFLPYHVQRGGRLAPLAGEISQPPEAIAYGAHADGLKATLSVAENLAFWAAVHGLRDIGPALDHFNLRSLASRAAQNLSAGQKRRLGLARLLVTGRPIWLLDEPTVSLDAASVGLFADAVRAHVADGGAALIATHIDLGLEARVFDVTPFKPDPETGLRTRSAFDEALT